jgi:voltage-gated potassium channel
MNPSLNTVHAVAHERSKLQKYICRFLDKPLLFLSLLWSILTIIEISMGLPDFFSNIALAIWGIFLIDFMVEFLIAPKKLIYLRQNILTAISVFLPALRIFRIFRMIKILQATSAVRTVRLVRMLSSLNRGIASVGKGLKKRGFGYILAMTVFVIFAGAAGILKFENVSQTQDSVQAGIRNYADAVWWTSMLMTTIGSEYSPKTAEGRILCFILSLYALTVFGYITASLASLFIGLDSPRNAVRHNQHNA